MKFRKILVPMAGVLLLAGAYRAYGWAGVALGAGAILMFVLLHFNRTMHVLRRASDRPIGSVASAVMLNAKLQQGRTLLHVIAMTRALGELRSPKDQQPELYRWTDSGGSWVDTEFHDGKLRSWSLTRPQVEEAAEPASSSDVGPAGRA